MTEQSKISLAKAKPVKAGESLFERADGAFGFDSIAPSPLMKKKRVAKTAVKPVAAKPVESAPQVQAQPAPKLEVPTKPVFERPAELEPKPAKQSSHQQVEAFKAKFASLVEQNTPKKSAPEPKPEPKLESKPAPKSAPNPVAKAAPETAPQLASKPAAMGAGSAGPVHALNRDILREEGLLVPDGPVTGLLEEFRIVKRQLLGDARAANSADARRILICSPHSGEGKTYCAVNLAIALAAERDLEVVLVDADFAKPSVLRVMGLEANRGFMDALADPSIQPESLVLRTDVPGLFVLPSGNRTASDAEYLGSNRTSEVLGQLTDNAPNRILIFDTPPALAASPAAELAKHVGQAVLVARADETGRNALEDAYQLLSACPDIKLLLNAARFSPSGRSFGSYGVYGEDDDATD